MKTPQKADPKAIPKTTMKPPTLKKPPAKTPTTKKTTTPFTLTKSQIGLMQQILKSTQATDLQNEFAEVADTSEPNTDGEPDSPDNPDGGGDNPDNNKENEGPDGNDEEPDQSADDDAEEKKLIEDAKKLSLEQKRNKDRNAERERNQYHIEDNRLKAAAKSALNKLSKISSQFGRTIEESVCLLHAAAKACQSTSDFRDGAEYVCSQS